MYALVCVDTENESMVQHCSVPHKFATAHATQSIKSKKYTIIRNLNVQCANCTSNCGGHVAVQIFQC